MREAQEIYSIRVEILFLQVDVLCEQLLNLKVE